MSAKSGINEVIGRSFIFANIVIWVIVFLGAIYFNNKSLEILRANNLEKTHEILTNFLLPALNVSDTTEILRLLTLSSDTNETFVVIDNGNDVLMPDYNKFKLVKELYNNQSGTPNCINLRSKNEYWPFQGAKYWVNCSSLVNNVIGQQQKMGILISFSKNPAVESSSLILYFLCIAIFSSLLIFIWFRNILYKRLMKPLVVFEKLIVNKTKSQVITDTTIGNIGDAPREVIAIKQAFENVLENLQSEYQQRTESEKKIAMLDLAARVAHDIRSPLSVMEVSLQGLAKEIPQEKIKMLQAAVQSVRDIANNLLGKYRDNRANNLVSLLIDNGNLPRPLLLHHIIEQVLSLKRYEWQDKLYNLEFNLSGTARLEWANVAPNEIKRALSNLLNNAYEAIEEHGKISLELYKIEDTLRLKIIDNGIGISANKLEAVLNGLSLKRQGIGLGLSSAKDYMKKLNGTLELSSEPSHGTQVILTFPLYHKPDWFPSDINIIIDGTVVILDDDNSMQMLWQHRLQDYDVSLKIFTEYQMAIDWYNKHKDFEKITYIADYELADNIHSGLDFLTQVDKFRYAYLITSHAEEIELQKNIQNKGIWLVPKVLANIIPLKEVN